MEKYIFALFCVLAIVAIATAGDDDQLKSIPRGGCYCHERRGTYCGSTKRSGPKKCGSKPSSGPLSGDCSEHDLYYCDSGNGGLAKWEGNCANGCYAGTGGRDYCH